MYQLEILLIFLIINLLFVINFNKIRLFQIVIDKPDNIRKLHKEPTALAGGIILIINIILYYLFVNFYYTETQKEIFFQNNTNLNFFLITSFSVFLIGLLDDKYNFDPLTKFFYLAFIISIFIYYDPTIKIEIIKFSFLENHINLKKYSFIFTLFCFLVFLNCFNMFDGINLQSCSYALIIFIYFLFITNFSIFISIIIIFIIFFMYLNFTNRSFFGDNGSLLISFVISYIFINLFNQNVILYSDTIFIFMIIPGMDMIRLFFERIKKKKNPFSFDRSHIHHLLINKCSILYTNLILILLVLIPVVLNFFYLNKLLIIMSTILTYSLMIFYLKK